jgi:hypothetical protein
MRPVVCGTKDPFQFECRCIHTISPSRFQPVTFKEETRVLKKSFLTSFKKKKKKKKMYFFYARVNT